MMAFCLTVASISSSAARRYAEAVACERRAIASTTTALTRASRAWVLQ